MENSTPYRVNPPLRISCSLVAPLDDRLIELPVRALLMNTPEHVFVSVAGAGLHRPLKRIIPG